MLSSLKKKQNHSEIFMSERVGKMLNFPFAEKRLRFSENTVRRFCDAYPTDLGNENTSR